MPLSVSDEPAGSARSRAARIAARQRWAGHDTRVVRLDDLTPEQRRLVLALVRAAKEEAASEVNADGPEVVERASAHSST